MAKSWMILLTSVLALSDPPEELEAYKRSVAGQAQVEIENLLQSVCPDRCMLLGVDIQAEKVRVAQDAMPGFEQLTPPQETFRAIRLTASIAVDAALQGSTARGLNQSVKRLLRSRASEVKVETQAFRWPTPRSTPPTPVVIRLSDDTVPAAEAPQDVASEPPMTTQARLLEGFVAAAPWLAGLLLGLLGLALLVWLWRRPQEIFDDWVEAPPLAEDVDAVREGEGKAGAGRPVAGVGAEALNVDQELLVDELRRTKALRLGVLKRALNEESSEVVARMLRLLDTKSLAAFHGTELNEKVQDVYAHLRTMPTPTDDGLAAALATLESLALDELREGAVAERLAGLHVLDEASFRLVANALDPSERRRLLLLSPRECREGYLSTLSATERFAFFREALDAIDTLQPNDVESLADTVAELMAEATRKRQLSLRAASALSQCLEGMPGEGQDHLLEQLQNASPDWKALIDTEVLSERDLIEAADDDIQRLVVEAKPEQLVDFMMSCSEALRGRLETMLPGYVEGMYQSASGRNLSPERAHRARSHIFGVWKQKIRNTRRRSTATDIAAWPRAKAS